MSRMGRKPVLLPQGATASLSAGRLSVKGPKGELVIEIIPPIRVVSEPGKILVTSDGDSSNGKSLHGLFRKRILNMVEGVTNGYVKNLEIQGVGFKAEVRGKKVVMALGFSRPVEYDIPDGITVKAEGGTSLVVSGVDKEKVGDVAARLRSFYVAEPYKGKGVRYKGEYVRRKVGKTVA